LKAKFRAGSTGASVGYDASAIQGRIDTCKNILNRFEVTPANVVKRTGLEQDKEGELKHRERGVRTLPVPKFQLGPSLELWNASSWTNQLQS